MPKDFIKLFNNVGIEDVGEVGGKNASLGEMIQYLEPQGVSIPGGYAVTASAYRYFLESTGLKEFIKEVLSGLNTKNLDDLAKKAKEVREKIKKTEFPKDLEEAIIEAHKKAENRFGKDVSFAVRSSATAEDLPDASFAGEHETYLHIKGIDNILQAVRNSMASLFTDRAISYRVDKGFDHFEIALSVGVQLMVRSDLGCSGVMFSLDTETGFPNVVLINGSWGLGEMVVQGEVTPDEYIVFKNTLGQAKKPIIDKKLGDKEQKMIYAKESPTKIISTSEKERLSLVLSDPEILQLATWAVLIEKHYSKKRGKWTPMDMEWAKDGETGKLYMVQARPETVHSTRDFSKVKEYERLENGEKIVSGASVGNKIAVGKAHVILNPADIEKFKAGEILITDMTDPDWEPIMKIASAIVTDKGGRTCFGDKTNIFTNEGFLTIKEAYDQVNNGGNLSIYAFDYQTKKTVWKKIKSAQKNKLKAIRINISQTGNAKFNTIDVTYDHKFFTYENRQLVKKPINEILNAKESVCLTDFLPRNQNLRSVSNKLAYLLGALSTDGCIHLRKGVKSWRRGEIIFTQKDCVEKQKFIQTVTSYFNDLYNKPMIAREFTSEGMIRGRLIKGTATHYRAYSLATALRLRNLQENLPILAASFSEKAALIFLAGVIDGDGAFYNNRIQIYVSKKNVQQAIIISCLRLGIIPQVTSNRNIFNIQILERISEILSYSKRIKFSPKRKILGNRLFAAKQLFEDIIDTVNYKGRIKPYVKNNLLIDCRKLKDYILPLTEGRLKTELEAILNSDLRMQRVSSEKDLGEIEVYNLEVEANNELDHNYVVFTERYTPLLVSNSHAAIVSRELGIPCIVGSVTATKKIRSGQVITVDTTGETGIVFKEELKFKVSEHDIKNLPRTKIKIMLNIATPGTAFEKSFLPNDGVGLAREEFIIADNIGIHPMALIDFNKLPKVAQKKINAKTLGYTDKVQYYIDKLSYGIAKIAAAFYPKEVIVRFSDFKTNEYRSLLGGYLFEPMEENPMIGWRGASRYYHPNFAAAFILELRAFKKVILEMGLTNVVPMVPFCRTVEEGKKVVKIIRENGLTNIKVYVMCEIPSNVILAEKFLEIFDGMSIGSNDLTQLTLGIDRDGNERIKGISNENDQAVKDLIAQVIKVCKAKGKYIGICGQAPSDYSEFAQFLVKEGITSMSLNPDSIIKTIPKIYQAEQK